MKLLLPALLAVLVAGCAAKPATIPPSMVSSAVYAEMSCKNLELELQSRYSELETLSKQQIDDRSWDIALNILLLPGFGAITGDQEDDIAACKGHIIAIRDQIAARCLEDDDDVLEE